MTTPRDSKAKHLIAQAAFLALVATSSAACNADLHAPPRFDGAGYAVLGRSLATGQGYRGIEHPDRPRHAHFPPGYPAVLALVWTGFGPAARVPAAHVLSRLCTVAATLAAWWWLRGLYRPRVAFLLGLALAVNWTWGRNGGGIQSEPLFFLLEQLAVLATVRAARRGGIGRGVALGLALAACVLTRHVGICLAVAAAVELGIRRRWTTAVVAWLVLLLLVAPWAVWLTTVHERTQVGLLTREHLPDRVARQGLFYLQRIPDQWVGPLVEIGTVFQKSPKVAFGVNAWAVLATGLVALGWIRALRVPRRRLAALVPLATLGLLLVWPFTEAGRFLVPLVPFLLVGIEEGLATVLATIGLRRARTWAASAILAASLPYAAYAVATGRAQAQRATFDDFDAACAWIARQEGRRGPILTRHPGEVYWQTGRQALAPESDDPEAIARLVDRYRVAYLLVDDARYARAPASPLHRFAERYGERAREVWSRSRGGSSVSVYVVDEARNRLDRN